MNVNSKQELRGRRYKCLRVVKGLSVEDIPAIRSSLKAQIDKIDGATMTETENSFDFNNGQFFLKPKQKREQIGILDCTKSFATFDGVRIEYRDMENVFACCFETSNAKYAIHGVID